MSGNSVVAVKGAPAGAGSTRAADTRSGDGAAQDCDRRRPVRRGRRAEERARPDGAAASLSPRFTGHLQSSSVDMCVPEPCTRTRRDAKGNKTLTGCALKFKYSKRRCAAQGLALLLHMTPRPNLKRLCGSRASGPPGAFDLPTFFAFGRGCVQLEDVGPPS